MIENKKDNETYCGQLQYLNELKSKCDNHILCHCICHNSLAGCIAQHCYPCCHTCEKCGQRRIVK